MHKSFLYFTCHLRILGSVHSMPDKFETGTFTPKTHQIFSVNATPEKGFHPKIHQMFTLSRKNLKTQPITVDRKAWVHPWGLGLITWLSTRQHFQKPPFSNCFSTLKRQPDVFKLLRFVLYRVFEKFRFRDGIVWTCGVTVKNKLPF